MAVYAGGLTAGGQRALTGGTLSANPLSCTAGYHALLEMDRTDAPAKAGAAGDRLRDGLAALIAKYDLPYVTYNFGSIVHLHTSGVLHLSLNDPEFFTELGPRKDMLGHMSMAFAAEGIVTLAGSRMYTSMADTDEVVDEALAGFERVFAQDPGRMTGAPALVIGVDLGTGGPKVALATDRGELVGLESASVATRILPGGGAEQDPDDWWQAIADCVRKLLAGHPGSADRVSAICFSSQWGGTVPVDAHGRATHPALIWMDGRGAQYAQEVTGGWPALPGSGYGPRKLRAWVAKTGGAPSRTGQDPVGQTLWLANQRPDAYAAARYLLDVPEYLTMRASGRAVTAFDTAVLRWCTDNRDPRRVRWDASARRGGAHRPRQASRDRAARQRRRHPDRPGGRGPRPAGRRAGGRGHRRHHRRGARRRRGGATTCRTCTWARARG